MEEKITHPSVAGVWQVFMISPSSEIHFVPT